MYNLIVTHQSYGDTRINFEFDCIMQPMTWKFLKLSVTSVISARRDGQVHHGEPVSGCS